ncbi:hypothetical protein E8E12_007286 [Didymella heteroderae]|uniref:Heterokaryon incompatibility domain-containing protein n=1 Tax=Didymella heteroderae TaxID=1769908 RepID=A0A9P5C139_9PLEO|nr:hypothetical protein E8E12_007286 [Didymella heteroderae]
MDAIYGNATVVIVAAAGCNANAGLPDVETRPRAKAQELETGTVKWYETTLLKRQLEASIYETRGWTFQEMYLARRKLFFFEQHMYLECDECTYRDSIVSENTHQMININDKRDGPVSPIPFAQPSEGFNYVTETYLQRRLSDEGDILKAFEGLAAYYSGRIESPIVCGWRFPIRVPSLKPGESTWLNATMYNVRRPTESGRAVDFISHTGTVCLEVTTIVLRFELDAPANNEVPVTSEVRGYMLKDRCGSVCGRVQLASPSSEALHQRHEFLVLKSSQHGFEYSSKVDLLDRHRYDELQAQVKEEVSLEIEHLLGRRFYRYNNYYLVMMVKSASGAFGVNNAKERVGIGLIYGKALLRSFDEDLTVSQIILV